MHTHRNIPDPFAELERFLESKTHPAPPSPPIAIFDCDGTIIAGDIGEAMLYYQLEHFLFRVSPADVWEDHPQREELHRLYHELLRIPEGMRKSSKGFVPFTEMVLARYFDQLAEMKTAKACADIVRLCAGFSVGGVREIARKTLEFERASPVSTRTFGRFTLPCGIRYIAETERALEAVREKGFEVWIVSGSNRWAVEAVFSRFNIPQDRIIGINLTEREGKLTPEIDGSIPVLEGKIKAMEFAEGTLPQIVFSDSVYDVPLFQYSAGKRVLINSRNGTSADFFTVGRMERDDSWIVIESPTLNEQNG